MEVTISSPKSLFDQACERDPELRAAFEEISKQMRRDLLGIDTETETRNEEPEWAQNLFRY